MDWKGHELRRQPGLRVHYPRSRRSRLFVHFSDVRGVGYRTLQNGQRVRFDEERGSKGPKATNVADAAEPSAVRWGVSRRFRPTLSAGQR